MSHLNRLIIVVTAVLSASHAYGSETIYSARFDWKASAAAAPQAMRLIIARNAHPRFTEAPLSARIMSGKRVVAYCQVGSLEVADREPVSLDLSCRSAALGTLAAPATLYFQRESILRFGTWLQGYEQATLKVDTDRRARLLQTMATGPVQLAASK